MATPTTTMARDKDEAVINPFTGQLDMVRNFEPNRVITHSCNPAGNPLTVYDPVSGAYFAADDSVVTDNQGNLITT